MAAIPPAHWSGDLVREFALTKEEIQEWPEGSTHRVLLLHRNCFDTSCNESPRGEVIPAETFFSL